MNKSSAFGVFSYSYKKKWTFLTWIRKLLLYSPVVSFNSILFIWSSKIFNPSWPTSGSRQRRSPPRWSCKSSRQNRTLLERTEQCSLKYSILFSAFSTHLGALLVCFLGFLADHQLTILHVKIFDATIFQTLARISRAAKVVTCELRELFQVYIFRIGGGGGRRKKTTVTQSLARTSRAARVVTSLPSGVVSSNSSPSWKWKQ